MTVLFRCQDCGATWATADGSATAHGFLPGSQGHRVYVALPKDAARWRDQITPIPPYARVPLLRFLLVIGLELVAFLVACAVLWR